MELKGEHIPKATMTSYLKDKVGKTKISTQFVEGILNLSKDYITRISNKANEVCTDQNKKTISLDHLYKSIQFFELKGQIEELKKVEVEVKQEVENRHAIKLKIQQSYEQMVRDGEIQLQKKDSLIIPLKQGVHSDLFQKDEEDSVDYEEQEAELIKDQKEQQKPVELKKDQN